MRRKQANLDYRIRARRERAAERLRTLMVQLIFVDPLVDNSRRVKELTTLEARIQS